MKKLLALLLVLMLTFSLAACAKDEPVAETEETTAAASTEAPKTLKIGRASCRGRV